MLEVETALIEAIDRYGVHQGKYNNLALKFYDWRLIDNILWIDKAISAVKDPKLHSRTYTYEDGSKIFVGALGELSWDFKFCPRDPLLALCVEGGQYQKLKPKY